MRIIMTLSETDIKNAIESYVQKLGYNIDKNTIVIRHDYSDSFEPQYFSDVEIKTQHTE